MKKRLIALFLGAIMGLSLVACATPDAGNPTDTGTQSVAGTSDGSQTDKNTNGSIGTASETDKTTSGSSQDTSGSNATSSTSSDSGSVTESSSQTATDNPGEEENVPTYDASLDHQVILTDHTAGSIVVLDLDNTANLGALDWKADPTLVVTEINVGDYSLSGVKYRYSSYYQKDVIIATSSGGALYIYEYNPQTAFPEQLLYSYDYAPYEDEISLYNAHCAEILPNGDVVVATSGYQKDGDGSNYRNGGIHYYPAGSKDRSDFLSLPFAHAVLWDDKNECLWAIGFEGVVAIKVTGSGKDATMEKIEGMGCKKRDFTGHDMVPAFGMDGKYWVSDNSKVYLFDSSTGKLTVSKEYNYKSIKGIAYFEDGTMALTDWSQYLVVHTTTPETYRVVKRVSQLSDKTYKVHTFTKNYT